MFMFRSRRSNLGRRLWKARVRSRHETGGKIKDWETLYRSGLLKEAQLELLVNAVETRDTSECVLLPRAGPVQEPHFLCCLLWRWPDLKSAADLKAIPASCKNADNDMYICCNPYHWSRLCKPESPPPPYCRFSRERLKPEDRAPSEGNCCGGDTSQLELRGSLATNGEGEWCSDEWCRLAYWELSRRVGRQYGVERPSVDVFWNEPRGDGLCLAALAMHSFSPQPHPNNSPPSHNNSYSSCGSNNNGSPPPPDAVRRAREKIGRGVTLCLEPDGVWAYNRSESPIFVHSPSLDQELSADTSCLSGTSQSGLLVQRVPPGHCLNVFVRQRPTPCDCMTSSPLMTSRFVTSSTQCTPSLQQCSNCTTSSFNCTTSSTPCNSCMMSSQQCTNCMTSSQRCTNCTTLSQPCNDCMMSSPTCMTSPTSCSNCMTSSQQCNNCTKSSQQCTNCATSPTRCDNDVVSSPSCMTSSTRCCVTSHCGVTSSPPPPPRTIITTPAGPVDPNSVRISFVKGWGPKYSRQEVTACPTWLEVLLAPCR